MCSEVTVREGRNSRDHRHSFEYIARLQADCYENRTYHVSTVTLSLREVQPAHSIGNRIL